jgi:hypothetical protein
MTVQRPFVRPLGAALLALALGGAPALAQSTTPTSSSRLTPAQQQKLFPTWRTISLQGVQGRLAILQRKQQCLTAASTVDALKTCQRQEREGAMALRQQQRAAIKQMYERNGIPLPKAAANWGPSI